MLALAYLSSQYRDDVLHLFVRVAQHHTELGVKLTHIVHYLEIYHTTERYTPITYCLVKRFSVVKLTHIVHHLKIYYTTDRYTPITYCKVILSISLKRFSAVKLTYIVHHLKI